MNPIDHTLEIKQHIIDSAAGTSRHATEVYSDEISPQFIDKKPIMTRLVKPDVKPPPPPYVKLDKYDCNPL